MRVALVFDVLGVLEVEAMEGCYPGTCSRDTQVARCSSMDEEVPLPLRWACGSICSAVRSEIPQIKGADVQECVGLGESFAVIVVRFLVLVPILRPFTIGEVDAVACRD